MSRAGSKDAALTGRTLLGILILALAATAAALVGPRARADVGDRTKPGATPPGTLVLLIGPVEGLTTGWHPAPESTGIPVGTNALFKVSDPPPGLEWDGADEVKRTERESIAVRPLDESGLARVTVSAPFGNQRMEDHVALEVIDVDPAEMTVSEVSVSWQELKLDRSGTQRDFNEQTMEFYFGPSIAGVRDLGGGRYRTSIERDLTTSVTVDPPVLAPLVEWRVNGAPARLGAVGSLEIRSVGDHDVRAGAPGRAASIEVETYRTVIVSHERGDDLVEGRPITFVAVTDPPGYESEITWLASTKWGTAEPALGVGPVFVTEFNGTFRGYGDVRPQWIGVKADSATFGQDQKAIPIEMCEDGTGRFCPGPEEKCWCDYDVVAVVGGAMTCDSFGLVVGAAFCLAPCPQGPIPGGPCLTPQLYIVNGTPCLFVGAAVAGCVDCFDGPRWRIVP